MPKPQCPTCRSVVPTERLLVPSKIEGQDKILCLDSWHPTQAFPVPEEANHIGPSCGSHCGVKDNMEAHCDCLVCHNGRREAEGFSALQSLDGRSVSGVKAIE